MADPIVFLGCRANVTPIGTLSDVARAGLGLFGLPDPQRQCEGEGRAIRTDRPPGHDMGREVYAASSSTASEFSQALSAHWWSNLGSPALEERWKRARCSAGSGPANSRT